MPDKKEAFQTAAPPSAPAVAPGYPAIETVKLIDVAGWEPAAVFRPVTGPGSGEVEESAT
ncbi:MAG: hypothetical protein O3B04_08520 [Chloroflexi bacterium]|nr:hypothetical protein [Chloroflexota bacterium]